MKEKLTDKDKMNKRVRKIASERRNRRRKFHKFWDEFCVTHYGRIISYTRSLARGDVSIGEDLAQGTVVKVLHNCPDPARILDPYSYVRRIAKNLSIDAIRPPEDNLDDMVERDPGHRSLVTPSDLEDLLANTELLRKSVGRLLTPKLLVMVRMWLAGHPWKDIAKVLNEPVATTRFRWYQFRARVREQVKRQAEANREARKAESE